MLATDGRRCSNRMPGSPARQGSRLTWPVTSDQFDPMEFWAAMEIGT